MSHKLLFTAITGKCVDLFAWNEKRALKLTVPAIITCHLNIKYHCLVFRWKMSTWVLIVGLGPRMVVHSLVSQLA